MTLKTGILLILFKNQTGSAHFTGTIDRFMISLSVRMQHLYKRMENEEQNPLFFMKESGPPDIDTLTEGSWCQTHCAEVTRTALQNHKWHADSVSSCLNYCYRN